MADTSKMEERSSIKIESPGVNCAVLRKEDEGWKFLLLKRSETESYGGTWGFVTGSRREGEAVAQVVLREVREETNLTAKRIFATEHVVHFYEPEVDAIWILPLVVAVVDCDAEVKLNFENCEYRWLPAHQAKRLVSWKNLMISIDRIQDELELYPARNWVEIKP